MPHSSLRTLAICLLLTVPALQACTSQLSGRPAPEMTFTQMQPLNLNVSEISIESAYTPGTDPDDISSTFPTRPDVVLKNYAQARLKAAQPPGGDRLRYIVRDARVLYKRVEPSQKLYQWLNVDRRDKYQIRAVIEMVVTDSMGYDKRGSTLTISRDITLPETLSIAGREQKQIESMEAMVAETDRALMNSVTNTLQIYQGY